MAQKSSYGKSNDSKIKKSSSLKRGGKTSPAPAKNKTGSTISKVPSAPGTSKPAKKTTDTPVYLKFVYAFMLLLMLTGGLARFAAKNARSKTTAGSAQVQSLGTSQPLSARALTFHRAGGPAEFCDDLVVSVSGEAVLTACSSGKESQYHLSAAEQRQLVTWLGTYKAFDFGPDKPDSTSGLTTKLSLNGQGTQLANAADLNAMLSFVSAIDSEIDAQQ
jgi:hypothetical protein